LSKKFLQEKNCLFFSLHRPISKLNQKSFSETWWQLVSISSTFYARIFRTKDNCATFSRILAKKNHFRMKNVCVKCWWNWHLVTCVCKQARTALQVKLEPITIFFSINCITTCFLLLQASTTTTIATTTTTLLRHLFRCTLSIFLSD